MNENLNSFKSKWQRVNPMCMQTNGPKDFKFSVNVNNN